MTDALARIEAVDLDEVEGRKVPPGGQIIRHRATGEILWVVSVLHHATSVHALSHWPVLLFAPTRDRAEERAVDRVSGELTGVRRENLHAHADPASLWVVDP